jgi:hypothetical protein
MNSKQIISLAGSALLAGGLFAGSIGWIAAQERPMTDTGGVDQSGSGMMADAASHETPDGMMGGMMSHMMGDTMDGMMSHMMGDMASGQGNSGMMDGMVGDHHARMQATLAEALGLTVEELQAEFEAGKMVPQVAEEQGVSLTDLHEELMGEFHMMYGR